MEKEICLDRISVDRINRLHPKLRAEALQILIEAAGALTGRAKLRITYGLRTMQEQQALYNQGRTTKGTKVTNAKPGQSFHNYGLAVDMALIIDGTVASWDTKADFDGDKKADWMEVVEIFKKYGWIWGGDFKTLVDMPHFEKTFGYHWSQLQARHNAGKVDKEGYVLI